MIAKRLIKDYTMLSYNGSGLYCEQNDPLVLTCRAEMRQSKVLQCNNTCTILREYYTHKHLHTHAYVLCIAFLSLIVQGEEIKQDCTYYRVDVVNL